MSGWVIFLTVFFANTAIVFKKIGISVHLLFCLGGAFCFLVLIISIHKNYQIDKKKPHFLNLVLLLMGTGKSFQRACEVANTMQRGVYKAYFQRIIYRIFYLKQSMADSFRKESESFYASMVEISKIKINQKRKLKALIEKYEKKQEIHQKKQSVLAPIYLQILIFISLYILCGIYRYASNGSFSDMDMVSLALMVSGIILSLLLSMSENRSVWDKF